MARKRSGTKHGEYLVVNTEKYLGSSNPKYRSSWEERWCYQLDHNKNVLKWHFEPFSIPYFYEVDKKEHKYIIDFYAEVLDKNGDTKKFILEIKPKKQTQLPKKPKNNNAKAQKRYITEVATFIKNKNKWDSAISFCKKKGLIFRIMTEDSMFLKR